MTECDPAPGAANTCPSGYHCAPDGFCDAVCTPGGNECGDGYVCTPDGRCKGEDECVGLECQVVECTSQGKPDTTLKGTVYAPNGTLPLYGINVYVPNEALPPFNEGAECGRCAENFPGAPITRAVTDEAGNFTLTGVPAGANIPLVITSGKWRRQITVSTVSECTENTVPNGEARLPKNKSEGDIPKIALTTGSADSLECLIRKLGIDDAEITNSSGSGRVHFYAGNGRNTFTSNWAGGGGEMMSSATDFWNDVNKLKAYDIVILSCEGNQHSETKPQEALDAMKAYADLGGRVFMSHWHNIWIGGAWADDGDQAPAVWTNVATWSDAPNPPNPVTDYIDEVNNPKGSAFATWMLNVMGSTVRGEIQVTSGRSTASTIDPTRAERWVYYDDGNTERPQNFQFTTPNEVAHDQRCGKVVFSDMHVSGGPLAGDYPNSCGNNGVVQPLTPQEKALAFMIFDLTTCIGVLL